MFTKDNASKAEEFPERAAKARFVIAPTLASDLLGSTYDGDYVAKKLVEAGFETIPLDGAKIVNKKFEQEADADAYVLSCVAPHKGEVLSRRVLEDGRAEVTACLPLYPEAGDRTKEPAVPRWQDIPIDLTWWRDRSVVPLPPGWSDWGKSKKSGKRVTERRGDSRRNVGVRTGVNAGLVVVDVDQKEGRDGLAALKAKFGDRLGGLLPPTFTVQTPTGGLHWYYETSAAVGNSASQLAPGVDVRGEGGYVVGPGSIRLSGRRYHVTACVAVAPLPAETEQMLLSLRPPRRERTRAGRPDGAALTKEDSLARCVERFPDVQPGQRHGVLLRMAGGARNLCADDGDLEWVIRQFAAHHGVDARDPDDLDRIVEDAKGFERTPPAPARQPIVVDVDEGRVVRELAKAMAQADGLYQRGQQLVYVVLPRRGSRVGRLHVVLVPREVVGPWTTDLVDWIRLKQDDEEVVEVPIHPPAWAVSAFHAARRWPDVPHLDAVVEFPILRPDGTVLAEPGYDASTGVYASIDEPMVVPRSPSRDDALAAMAALEEIFCDFPFADEASRSAAVAGLLTPLARHAFEAPVPLFCVDKAARGTGGSLLADCVGVLLTGRPMPRVPQSGNDEEQRKLITALMIEAAPLVLIDNLSHPLGGPALDALLTGTVWKDRLLGSSQTVTVPNGATFFATGNNVTYQGDTSRRTLRIRLESPLENPEDRGGFAHPDLLAWIAAERARLLSAALTVLRGYVVAGRPAIQLRPFGSFEKWSGLVAAAIAWCGRPDPALARAAADDDLDADKQALMELITEWREVDPRGDGMTVRALIERLRGDAASSSHPGIRQLLTHPVSGRLLAPHAAGTRLRKFKGRVWSGRCLTTKLDRTGTSVWCVRRVTGEPDELPDAPEPDARSEPCNGAEGDRPFLRVVNFDEVLG